MKEIKIKFESSARAEILEALGLLRDTDGFLIEQASLKRVLDEDGKPVQFENVAGIQNGRLIKSDLTSLMKFHLKQKLK